MLTTESRPVTFSTMVGQERTLAVLRSVLASGNIPSTLLLTGSYGSGKTSAARILAAMVNCANPTNKDACGECNSCVTIADGRSDALVEIDSAVYGSADNVRTLTELVHLTPASKYRVVILDEAHALSKVAFTALLKVMEEAPVNVIFVLVTTELSKVPDTVRSRAVSFYFGPLSSSQMEQRLRHLCEIYKIYFEPGALHTIANQAPSLRDAVKILDVLNTAFGAVRQEQALSLLGDVDSVKVVLRKVFSHGDYEDEIDLMFANCSPLFVLEVVVNVLTLIYQKGNIDTGTYTKALDIAWTLVPIVQFDGRGKVVTRLAFKRLGLLFPKE